MGDTASTGEPGDADRSAAWTPPTDVERALYDAKSRADWDGYKRVLLRAETLTFAVKDEVDEVGAAASMLLFNAPDGGRCFVVHTRGQLPARHPDLVLCAVPLPPGPAFDGLDGPPGLLVNPGTPDEAYFPADQGQDHHWRALAVEAPERARGDGALLTKYTGPLHGPLAHALACGTHLAVHNQVLWNDLGDVCGDYLRDVAILRESWGVFDRAGWREQLTQLLQEPAAPSLQEFALGVRREIARRYPGAHTDPQLWRRVTANTLRERGADELEVAASGSLIGRITRYESRFRADDLLPPDGYVTSALGYDYGRAVSFARWGLGARYAERPEVEQAVLRAGRLCRERYTSWDDFSAGYILGRALRYDEEAFGPMYGSALTPHRVLAGSPDSPWNTVPFHLNAQAL